eukprot:CAMPEP_0178507684 /NCGR_PEP_ID=MMETSP0696-20121128/20348_1 /TAXON_ID=265572 /ORGANISM="Extubocellulus spinifer, Strain CCMP396" /LENGTH=33 /DNA_ID= /DNA_START= /DNA_END= /DNA_ORIENTATION=
MSILQQLAVVLCPPSKEATELRVVKASQNGNGG